MAITIHVYVYIYTYVHKHVQREHVHVWLAKHAHTRLVAGHTLHILNQILNRVSYRGGGALGYPPPRSSFPPPRISYHNVIMNQIENCTSINASGVVATTSCNYPKCIRINLRECKDQKFSGGACPQTPLVCRASTKHGFPPPSLKSCMKPCSMRVPAIKCGKRDLPFAFLMVSLNSNISW